MKGDKQVITLLNDVLTAELTAVNQYFLHARLCHHWGYGRLYERVRKESIEEMKHADELIERILYLEGMPNVQRYGKVNVGQTVPEQFQLDLQVEYDAVKRLNEGIEACRTAGDNGTRTLLERILHEEEAHVDWLETQQETIKQVGAGTYLSEQLK
ncbi:MAG: bacterioferritin [Deltaproteobacteria bacterium]|jgi:bacterioferritin|nr:MAG: bacterioferritin [Deltaproteobacteria bacterium]